MANNVTEAANFSGDNLESNPAPPPNQSPRFKKSMRILIILLIIAGIMSISLQLITQKLYKEKEFKENEFVPGISDEMGTGMWSGGAFVLSGAFSLLWLAKPKPITATLSILIFILSLNLSATVFMFTGMAIGNIGSKLDPVYCDQYWQSCYIWYFLECTMIVINGLAVIICLIATFMTCRNHRKTLLRENPGIVVLSDGRAYALTPLTGPGNQRIVNQIQQRQSLINGTNVIYV